MTGGRLLRTCALVVWAAALVAFWLAVRRSDVGPAELLVEAIRTAALAPWAPAVLLVGYLARPLALVPITVLNLACGYLLGLGAGWPVAMVGTLLSASVGYAIGRWVAEDAGAERLARRWRFVRFLRHRSFESVAAGGLMYLHADMVNLPSGLLRIPFRSFLAGIAVGNLLTATGAVLAGASVEGGPTDLVARVQPSYVVAASLLLLVSMTLAYWLRKRFRPVA